MLVAGLVERLQYFQTVLADTSQEQSQRAIALAWVLHLVGDIHQPLHNSARVTATEPEGDRGGNLFLLDTTRTDFRNLHSFWDGILSLTFHQKPVESDELLLLFCKRRCVCFLDVPALFFAKPDFRTIYWLRNEKISEVCCVE